jgi:hypothetical protein
MKLFPFTTLRSQAAEPSLGDITRRMIPVAFTIGLGVGVINAITHPGKAGILLVVSIGASLAGGLGFIGVFFALTRLARYSGYKPFVCTCPSGVTPDDFAAKLSATLKDLGFRPEGKASADGSVWVLEDKKQEAQLFLHGSYPLRAFVFREALGVDRRPHLVLQIKGTPVWDTGETKYLTEIGGGIVTLAGLGPR